MTGTDQPWLMGRGLGPASSSICSWRRATQRKGQKGTRNFAEPVGRLAHWFGCCPDSMDRWMTGDGQKRTPQWGNAAFGWSESNLPFRSQGRPWILDGVRAGGYSVPLVGHVYRDPPTYVDPLSARELKPRNTKKSRRRSGTASSTPSVPAAAVFPSSRRLLLLASSQSFRPRLPRQYRDAALPTSPSGPRSRPAARSAHEPKGARAHAHTRARTPGHPRNPSVASAVWPSKPRKPRARAPARRASDSTVAARPCRRPRPRWRRGSLTPRWCT